MGTRVRLSVESPSRDLAARAAEQALRTIEDAEALLSTWEEESPLSALNRSDVGHRITMPEKLLTLLLEVETWSQRTGGAFDATVGPLIDVWGVRSVARVPSQAELAEALTASGSDSFVIDSPTGTAVRARSDAWIDAGGFGKGAALRDVDSLLRDLGTSRAFVDLGGQVLALSNDSDPWRFEVAHPLRRDNALVPLHLVNVSAATSGASERPGHLLDPRDGHPVADWGSVTVVDPDPMVADILATALYVMGPEEGLEWASDQKDVAALFLVLEGDVVVARWTPPMARWLEHAPALLKKPIETLN
jgi:thiamine biosynthesis lipoprotein